jgi:hypothetical protein
MSRVIFVGIHNKPDKPPLCPTTLAGKGISAIVAGLPTGTEVLRSNLFDLDRMPNEQEAYIHRNGWLERTSATPNDIIVLLGAITHFHWRFMAQQGRVIRIGHPSARMSVEKRNKYLQNAIDKITEKLQQTFSA